MKYTLYLINRYLLQNDLYNSISFVGGDNIQCRVEMCLNSYNRIMELYRFIKTMKKFTNCRITLKLNKSTNQGIITFRKEVA